MKNNNPQAGSNDVCGNAAQMKAILHKDGPAMVLAGPGSGKTFVIVQRLKALIERYKVRPESILVITFTKAAAIEMQQRFMKVTDSSYPEVCFGTFHSVFYQIIRQSNPNHKLDIISEGNKYKLLRDILYRLMSKGIISKQELAEDTEIMKDIISEISKVKNTGFVFKEDNPENSVCQHFKVIFEEYNKSLKEFEFIDFDDMVLRCYKLLSENKVLLDRWSERFKYILIDEYQDINSVQYSVVGLLCRSKNLFVVGDDDQSIYGFRGSDPGIMQSFPEDFQNFSPNIINLNINYRCGKNILDNAMQLISENKLRYKKELSANDSNGKGGIFGRKYESIQKQSEAITAFIKSEQQKSDKKIALIFRTNSEALSIAAVLKEAGIRTNLENYAKSFCDSKAVILCENYISFVVNGFQREDFFKIMNKPQRYISREAVNEKVSVNDLLKYYAGNSSKIKVVEKLFRQLNMLSHMRPSLCIRFIRKEIGIDSLFPDETDALDKLSDLASGVFDNNSLLKKLNEIRENEISGKKNVKSVNSADTVQLVTMHASKGLEYDIVWLPNLNEGIIPSRSAFNQKDIEEERRLLYVAMTRAKSTLIMSYISGSEQNPMLPSRFLRPLKKIWEENYSSPSNPSSGSSMISSNSTSSR